MAIGLAGAALWGAAPAAAHVSPDLVVSAPADRATVGPGVDVVLTAAAEGIGRTDFVLQLDGQPVDADGRVGQAAVFTSLSLGAGEKRTIGLAGLSDGEHQLTVRYADTDNPKPDVVRSFRVAAPAQRSRGATVAAGAVFLLLMAAAIVIRRRGLRAAQR